ncbi:hypothetical protein EDB80DRAFT_717369 [Ilyonectria destructans]|nr:hypothetical protein EDB80DRAFT_717369 [Ilyonectria destructans]
MKMHPLPTNGRETMGIGSSPYRKAFSQRQRQHRASPSYNAPRGMARINEDWGVLRAAILLAAGISSLVINGYYQSSRTYQQSSDGYSLSSPSSSILHFIEAGVSSFQAQQSEEQYLRLPVFVRDPSPEHLLAACLVYGISMNGYYHIHNSDRYQCWFATSGVLLAFAVGWTGAEDVHGILMGFMPWFLILSLVLSAAFHKAHARNQSQ